MAMTDLTRDHKIEIRLTGPEKEGVQNSARRAGYGIREVSRWVRDVLSGKKLHPDYEEVDEEGSPKVRGA